MKTPLKISHQLLFLTGVRLQPAVLLASVAWEAVPVLVGCVQGMGVQTRAAWLQMPALNTPFHPLVVKEERRERQGNK